MSCLLQRISSPVWLLVGWCLFVSPLLAQTQTAATRTEQASISGRVTKDGKPAAGVTVSARQVDAREWQATAPRAQTDAEGRFHLTELPPGQYAIKALLQNWVSPEQARGLGQSAQGYRLAAGENLEGIEIQLTRGGVVTGRVTDAKGRPVIGKAVRLCQANEWANTTGPMKEQMARMCLRVMGMAATDDRGEYRIYGVFPGTYAAAAGEDDSARVFNRSVYPLTFHPNARGLGKATLVSVGAGEEKTGIDIQLAARSAEERKESDNFSLSGRVVDAQSGKPVAGLELGYVQSLGDLASSRTSGGIKTDAAGKFTLTEVARGRYAFYVSQEYPVTRAGYVEQRWIEVAGDVSGAELLFSRGITITGEVELIGANLAELLKATEVSVQCEPVIRTQEDWQNRSQQDSSTTRLDANGRFQLAGLRQGKYHLNLWPQNGRRLPMSRLERNGQPLPNLELELSAGEPLVKLRAVLLAGSGSIRGQVIFPDGFASAGLEVQVIARLVGATESMRPHFTNANNQWRFIFEEIPAGDYELNVSAFRSQSDGSRIGIPLEPNAARVNVGQTGSSDITITLKPATERRRPND